MRGASESKKNVILRGSAEPHPRPAALRAGRLSLSYCNGELRNCIAGNTEIARRIYVAVRDRHWNTVKPVISNLRVQRGRNSFSIRFDCRHRRDSIDFVWHASIDGAENGTTSFRLDAEALSSFEANRIGFCVLLPLEGYLGKSCEVEKVDGTRIRARFPGKTIRPHQPFANMRALFLTFQEGISSEIRFEGDTFEMEDQRNWTDASFKVYCPPLAGPIPFRVNEGDRFAQRILLRLKSPRSFRSPAMQQQETVEGFSRQSYSIPDIGVGLGDSCGPPSTREVALVRACGFSHVRSTIRFDNREIVRTLRMAAQHAEALGLPLELVLFFRAGPLSVIKDAKVISDAFHKIHTRVKRCLVFRLDERVTSQKTLSAFYAGALRLSDKAEVVTGTDGNFVEINRNKPALRGARAVCYSVNPQVHTFDDEGIIENLEGQYHVLRTARARFPGKKIIVTPVTMRPRLNPLAPRKDHGPDPRQKSLLGAVWTLGSIIQSARGGAAAVTYFEISGDCGIMERGGCRVFPMFHVLADVGEYASGRLRPLDTLTDAGIDGCMLEKGGRRRYLIANLTPVSQRAVLRRMPRALVARRLDERSFERACSRPLDFRLECGRRVAAKDGTLRIALRPYAMIRLDEV